MTAIVLVGVMADRPALTLRTLAVAAFGVLLLAPQSVVHPSFQMSFAATLALIAAYERGLPWMVAGADTSVGARVALWGGREIVALILASMVAGLATTPYAAFHFHRLAPYGVIANLLAMPIVSVWVMPMGLLGPYRHPVRLRRPVLAADGRRHRLDDRGRAVRRASAGRGRADGGVRGRAAAARHRRARRAVPSENAAALERRRPGRHRQPMAVRTPLPDVLVSTDGQALRGSRAPTDGCRSTAPAATPLPSRSGSPPMATRGCPTIRPWGRGSAATRPAASRVLPDGKLVSQVITPDAFEEDCRLAAVVVTSRELPGECKALVVDRKVSRGNGAIALRWNGEGFEITAARPPGLDRPWARGPVVPDETAVAATSAAPRDATPRAEDLEAGD